MSKLDDIRIDLGYAIGDFKDAPEAQQEVKDLIRDLIEETFSKDDSKAYELWKKIEAL